jgi:cytochrome c peroxidase
MRSTRWLVGLGAVAALAGSCAKRGGDGRAAEASSGVPSTSAVAAQVAARPLAPTTTRSGSMLARSPADDALYLADEDHQALRRFDMPLDVNRPVVSVPMPGRPAQVLALGDRVLVTIRDPGLLLELRSTRSGFTETRRVKLPSDAWGLAITADQRTALVTSAWSHRVSGVDLDSMQVRFSLDVAREPRGIAITEAGTAFVGHLVGTELSRIEALDTSEPRVTRVNLAPAPLRTPRGATLGASLTYAPVLSADDSKLFVPRHALGASGFERWFGVPVVDTMLTATGEALAPPRATATARWEADEFTQSARTELLRDVDGSVLTDDPLLTQPRAAVVRKTTDTVLVASEGTNALVELDARSLEPSSAVIARYAIGKLDESVKPNDPSAHVVVACGAPSAIALSADEATAYVYGRSTNDLCVVRLADAEGKREEGPIPVLHITDDTLSPEAKKGKRLFYDAVDETMSGGLACAGCHPEGRDDGFVWSEIEGDGAERSFTALPRFSADGSTLGAPRQTPMLAGRVSAEVSYGWHGESKTITDRVRDSFGLHRWRGGSWAPTMDRPKAIVAFLREGLVPPAREERAPTDEEARGKAIFESDETGCTTCHVPAHELTDRTPRELPREARVKGFAAEKDRAFKTPSLFYVGGTPPYFHDGAAKTLEDLVAKNADSMGHTSHLGPRERAALVAYLRTL